MALMRKRFGWKVSVRSLMNASCLPSGDQVGSSSLEVRTVTCETVRPFAGMM